MAYSIEIAKLLTNELTRFVSFQRHQLASQIANLEFWLEEVQHCFNVIDGYNSRLDRIKAVEVDRPRRHDPPRKIPDGELASARHDLREATYHFLVHCFNHGLLDRAVLKGSCDKLAISIATSDLKPQRQ